MEKKNENPLVIQLKQNLSLDTQNLFDNETYERFLIANQNNMEETLKNLKDFAAWQDELDRQNFLTSQQIRDLKTLYPHGYSGIDIEGRPVLIEQIGKIKVADLFKMIEDAHLGLYFAQRMEQLRNQIFPHVQKKQLLVIIDLKGQIMKMGSKRVYTIIQNAVNIFQRYYPQTLHKVYFVNTPLLFETIWSLIKKNISPQTQKKIVFLGSDFEQQIEKIVTRSNLPQSLGGNIDDDEFTEEDHGPWVKGYKKASHSSSQSEQEIDFSNFKDLKAALSNVLPASHQVPHPNPQTPLNTESDEKN